MTAQTCNCGTLKEWRECYACGGFGYSGHDCGEDSCCCADPVDNIPCQICQSVGGWWDCPSCNPEQECA